MGGDATACEASSNRGKLRFAPPVEDRLRGFDHDLESSKLSRCRSGFDHRAQLARFEIMIETTQAILNGRGESSLPRLLDASAGRCIAAHFGTYDYTASCSITAAYQTMTHPACDFAKHMMQVAFAGTGIWISDGATNILPAPPHRVEKGKRLTRAQRGENRDAVHRAWRLHYEHIQHSLVSAYYQGWDLHPAQLPTRYAAVYSFFLEGSIPPPRA